MKNKVNRATLMMFQIARNNELQEIENNLKNRELKQNKEIAEKELAVKDRVDLSLKEYKELQNKIEVLESNNDFLEGIFNKLKLKDYLSNIDFETIEIRTYKDNLRCKHKMVITFDLEVFD